MSPVCFQLVPPQLCKESKHTSMLTVRQGYTWVFFFLNRYYLYYMVQQMIAIYFLIEINTFLEYEQLFERS